MKLPIVLLLLLVAGARSEDDANTDPEPEPVEVNKFRLCMAACLSRSSCCVSMQTFSVPSTDGSVFADTFETDPFESGRWVKTTSENYAGQEVKIGAGTLPGIYAADNVRTHEL